MYILHVAGPIPGHLPTNTACTETPNWKHVNAALPTMSLPSRPRCYRVGQAVATYSTPPRLEPQRSKEETAVAATATGYATHKQCSRNNVPKVCFDLPRRTYRLCASLRVVPIDLAYNYVAVP